MSNEFETEEGELSIEINEEKYEQMKAQVHVLLHIEKCNFVAWEVNSDFYRPRSIQPINTKYDVNQALCRYQKLRPYITAINCRICGRERQKQ